MENGLPEQVCILPRAPCCLLIMQGPKVGSNVQTELAIYCPQITGDEGLLHRSADGNLEAFKTTASFEKYKVKLQAPEVVNSFCRLQDRAPGRGMDASMLIKRKALGDTGKKVAMVAAPLLLWCHVPMGLSQLKMLPWMAFKFNVVEMDENGEVTFGVKDYPPWVSAFQKASTFHFDRLLVSGLHADEETTSRRNICFLHQDGAGGDGCRRGAVQDGEREAEQSSPVRKPCSRVAFATASGAQNEEFTQPALSHRGREHRGHCRRGTPVQDELAPLPCSLARLRPVVGGMASTWKGIERRPSRELGTGSELEGNQSIGTMGSSEGGGSDGGVIERACSGCNSMLRQFTNQQVSPPVFCDAVTHVGDRQLLAGQVC